MPSVAVEGVVGRFVVLDSFVVVVGLLVVVVVCGGFHSAARVNYCYINVKLCLQHVSAAFSCSYVSLSSEIQSNLAL